MPVTSGFLASTIGKKVVMAITGLILFGFVFGHMAGNLQVYLGPEVMNEYAEKLRELLHGAGLWIARIGLLGAVVLHIWAAIALWAVNRAARPIAYAKLEPDASTYASRTMKWGGPIILLFVIYHLLHLTTGQAHPDFIPGDVYHNFVAGFEQVPASVAYMLATLALGLHLRHGVWSMLRTLGLSHPRFGKLAETAALIFALIVTLGNLSFPIAVLAGVLQ